MKNRLLLIYLLSACILTGCVKDLEKAGVSETTKLKGRVLEESQHAPLSDVKVTVTDGKTVYLNTTTNQNGEFALDVDFERINESSYLWLKRDDNVSEITKRVELKGMGKVIYDYEDIFLFNENDDGVPSVVTDMLSDISENSARCGGNVMSDGGSAVIERGICWTTAQNPTISDHTVSDGGGTGSYSCEMTGLSPNTKYYVRAYAINRIGVSYGVTKNFTTLEPGSGNTPPTVTTSPVSSITAGSAVCGGDITSDGGAPIIRRGICWSDSANPQVDIDETMVEGGVGTGSFSCAMTGLQPNTIYHVRAFATNEKGTSYGEDLYFNTLTALSDGWLGYGDESSLINYGWGINGGGQDEWAVMLPAEQLAPYYGTSITKVKTYIRETGEYVLRIYEGGTNAPSNQVKALGYQINNTGWATLLVDAVSLNTTENLWISLSYTYEAGHYPKSVFEGVNDPNARWCNNNGFWYDVYDYNEGNDLAWAIIVYVTNEAKNGEERLLPSSGYGAGETALKTDHGTSVKPSFVPKPRSQSVPLIEGPISKYHINNQNKHGQ